MRVRYRLTGQGPPKVCAAVNQIGQQGNDHHNNRNYQGSRPVDPTSRFRQLKSSCRAFRREGRYALGDCGVVRARDEPRGVAEHRPRLAGHPLAANILPNRRGLRGQEQHDSPGVPKV